MIDYILIVLIIWFFSLILLFISEVIILHSNFSKWIYIDNKKSHSIAHIEYTSLYILFLIFSSTYFILRQFWIWIEYEKYSLVISLFLFCLSNFSLYKHIVSERKWL